MLLPSKALVIVPLDLEELLEVNLTIYFALQCCICSSTARKEIHQNMAHYSGTFALRKRKTSQKGIKNKSTKDKFSTKDKRLSPKYLH